MTPLQAPALQQRGPGHARAFVFWVALATLIALALRLYKLDTAGFWVDELYTIYVTANVNITHNSKAFGYLPTWLGFLLSGVNPWHIPQHDYDSSMWRAMGVTHTSARIGSAFAGIITVPLVAIASRRLLGNGGAVMLALLLATSPWHIYWSQAARFYSFQFLFYTLALVYYLTATRTASRPHFVLAMACIVLAFLSQPTALAILAIFAADWLIAQARQRPLPLGLFEWFVGAAAVGLCAAIFALDYFNAPDQWAQFVAFAGAEYQPPHRLAMGAAYMTGPAVIIAALTAAWAIRRSDERLTIYLLLSALLPIFVFAGWSMWNAVGLRYLLICLFGWLALAAIGLDRLATMIHRHRGDNLLALAPLAVVIASAAHLFAGYYGNAYGFHPRWPEAYATVAASAQPGDVIACRHPIVGRYYLERRDIAHLPDNPQELAELGERVWLVVETEATGHSDIGPWIHEHTRLVRCLELAIPRPVSRVSILLYERSQDESMPHPVPTLE
jgi:4-amino-4-deoxy-L-arabinose transferase-like glycosyltransferase